MSLAQPQVEILGAKQYQPDGPFDFVTTFPTQRVGYPVSGELGAEWVPVFFDATAGQTVRQGDALVWDDNYVAIVCTTANATRGMDFGTAYFGGRYGDSASNGAIGSGAPFAYTFPLTGRYEMWVQRAGTSLLNVNATAATNNLMETTATASVAGAPASATVGSKLIAGAYLPPTTITFTANTVLGSNQLSVVSLTKQLAVGQSISGAGIPTGTYIAAISAGTITMSAVATATASTITVTMTMYSFTANTTNTSNVLTSPSTVYGIYPGQTITGTGIPASTTITAINGVPGSYTITLSANATATGSAVAMTTSLYVEAYLKWSYIDKTN
jgi:hypothetical protein